MKMRKFQFLAARLLGLWVVNEAVATNPLITDQFTADPTARVFEGKIYLYPSHDIPYQAGKGRTNWFIMEDYHVFSSENLTDWHDHGVILNQTNIAWVDPHSYSMWAPDCVCKKGRYYFYFPAPPQERGGFRIGVAVADRPYGPFQPEDKPIDGVRGIDPCVFFDRDGSAYLFYSARRIFVARLKENMLELDSMPQVITNLPSVGLLEGPFVFERNGIYYLTYPHVQNTIERLEYAISTNVLGPFTPAGVILDESPTGCWTVHHSIVEFEGQWYLFYHDKDLSPDFDKNRSVRADYLFFNPDGTIKKVIPTLRGVGIPDASSTLQIDRYSAISPAGASVSFLNETNGFDGWKLSLQGTNSWARFDRVNFGKTRWKSVNARCASARGGVFEIHIDRPDGPVLAKVKIRKNSQWKIIHSQLSDSPTGIHHLVIVQKRNSDVELDWIRFE